MAVQTDFLDVGFLISAGDYRNSTLTGTTLSGPNGSGQFLLVGMTTAAADFTVSVSSAGSTLPVFGVLQNKPSTGLPADIKIFGVSKVVLGSTTGVTALVAGCPIAISSVSSGCVSYASSTAAYRIGMALQTPSTAGTVFSAFLYGVGGGVSWLQAA